VVEGIIGFFILLLNENFGTCFQIFYSNLYKEIHVPTNPQRIPLFRIIPGLEQSSGIKWARCPQKRRSCTTSQKTDKMEVLKIKKFSMKNHRHYEVCTADKWFPVIGNYK